MAFLPLGAAASFFARHGITSPDQAIDTGDRALDGALGCFLGAWRYDLDQERGAA